MAREWADELKDERQDLYTVEDGRDPQDESPGLLIRMKKKLVATVFVWVGLLILLWILGHLLPR